MKTFAQIIKDNIDKPFILKPPKPLDPLLKEIKEFYINIDGNVNIHKSQLVYSKLFKHPVECVFYWCEDSWKGNLFVIYKYLKVKKEFFICYYGNFVSCECDKCPENKNLLNCIFNNLKVFNDIKEINLTDFIQDNIHNQLQSEFNNFKKKIEEKIEEKIQKVKVQRSWVSVVKKK
jgi:hypothetical protein